MTIGVITLPSNKSVAEAAKLLAKTKVGSVIITENKKAVGIVTEKDIIEKVVAKDKDPKKAALKGIMSTPLRVIRAGENIQDAALTLKKNKVKRLPVIDDKKRLVGIITEGDILRAYPGLVEILTEIKGMKFGEDEVFTGVCEECGLNSDDLVRDEGRLLCEDCREEEEV